jgi:subtilisin family serine protease
MHSDVEVAFSNGIRGLGSHIIIVDDHTYLDDGSGINGRLSGATVQNREHGYWTSLQASMIAPDATIKDLDWNSTYRIETRFVDGLNVVNLSYSLIGQAGLPVVNLGSLNNSIVTAASDGSAVIVKAAGNTWGGTVDGSFFLDGVNSQDYLNLALIGQSGTLFVGALEGNGTTDAQAAMASYSTVAGGSKRVQKQFLVVGVEGGQLSGDEFANYGDACGTVDGTCLYGTSFAAPIVSGYAALLGGKFTSATPSMIVDQLLNTARTDTILNYNAKVHGKGEADLSYALAPAAIN